MNIKIEAKTKPETPRRAVRFNGKQWANCSEVFYQGAMVGNNYEVEIEKDAKGYMTITPVSNGDRGEASRVAQAYKPSNNNGNSEVMTKADWKEKERFIAKTAIMKSCLESPALAEAIKLEGASSVAPYAQLLFTEMWRTFNEADK